MKKKKKIIEENINIQYYEELVKSYLHGNLAGDDQKQFEKDLQSNTILKNEVEKQVKYHQSVENNKDVKRNEKRSIISEISFLNKRWHFIYLVLIILIIFFLIFAADIRYNRKDIRNSKLLTNSLPHELQSSSINNSFYLISQEDMELITQEDIKNAQFIVNQLYSCNPLLYETLYKMGIHSIQTKDFQKASTVFFTLLQSDNNLYKEEIEYYFALSLLLNHDVDEGLLKLNIIIKNPQHKFYDESLNIIDNYKR